MKGEILPDTAQTKAKSATAEDNGTPTRDEWVLFCHPLTLHSRLTLTYLSCYHQGGFTSFLLRLDGFLEVIIQSIMTPTILTLWLLHFHNKVSLRYTTISKAIRRLHQHSFHLLFKPCMDNAEDSVNAFHLRDEAAAISQDHRHGLSAASKSAHQLALAVNSIPA